MLSIHIYCSFLQYNASYVFIKWCRVLSFTHRTQINFLGSEAVMLKICTYTTVYNAICRVLHTHSHGQQHTKWTSKVFVAIKALRHSNRHSLHLTTHHLWTKLTDTVVWSLMQSHQILNGYKGATSKDSYLAMTDNNEY